MGIIYLNIFYFNVFIIMIEFTYLKMYNVVMEKIIIRNAFTVVELLVVTAIIAILSTLLYPVIQKSYVNMKIKQTKSELVKIEAALELYYDAKNVYPSPISCSTFNDCLPREDLDDYGRFDQSRKSGDTYLDPWFQPYRYQLGDDIGGPAGSNNDGFVDISSAGQDRDYGADWQADTGSYDAGNSEYADNLNNWTEK